MSTNPQFRVLIVRLGAMGDILHALPAVTALRRAEPGWHIGWAVEPQWQALLRAASPPPDPASARKTVSGHPPPVLGTDATQPANQPLVDTLHLVPAKRWALRPLALSTLGELAATRSALAKAGYDAALDLQGALRSALLARWAHPARLLGEAAPREPLARFLFPERISTIGVHVIEQAAELVHALTPISGPGLPLLPHDPQARLWCDAAGVPDDRTTRLLLHPGAGWGAKRWPPERYAEAAASLARRTGARILINAAPGELPLGHALSARLHSLGTQPVLLSPTLGQLIELTRRCSLAIGGDTGPLHLAAALGLPTVGIYGPTDPARNGPFHGRFRVLRDPASRRDHTRHAAPEAGLLRITPEAVTAAALELLQGFP